jgi:phage shock protein PspC (stress-responsive transcriptional regulator)
MSSRPNNLRINHEERRFLGVCAGIADYLDIPVVLVRIICVVSFLTWPTLLIAYFALYFWLEKDMSTEKVQEWFSGNKTTEHFKNLDYRRPLYRNMRNRRVAGVCSGIADYLEIRVSLVRCVAIVAALVMGPYALLVYGVAWFVMEPNPAPRRGSSYRHHRSRRQRRRQRRHERRFASSRINNIDDDGSMDDLYDDAASDDLYAPEPPDPAEVMIDLKLARSSKKTSDSRRSFNEKGLEECTDTYLTLENRLRELEAYITSKKFRLHCEINNI